MRRALHLLTCSLTAAALAVATVPAGCVTNGRPAAAAEETCAFETTSCRSTTMKIHVQEKLAGYLQTDKDAPAGTLYIRDIDSNNLGFITPGGHLWRYTESGSTEKIHHAKLMKNLSVFFGCAEKEIALIDL